MENEGTALREIHAKIDEAVVRVLKEVAPFLRTNLSVEASKKIVRHIMVEGAVIAKAQSNAQLRDILEFTRDLRRQYDV